MLVRKFEAKTIQDAIQMVKTQLGPDAVILSAKDNKQKYGLSGNSSVEVTAAVSEETLKKKKLAETKLNSTGMARFSSSSARNQKEFIDRVFDNYSNNEEDAVITKTRYIDIIDKDSSAEEVVAPSVDVAQERISSAVKRAMNAFEPEKETPKPTPVENADDFVELNTMRAEIEYLRGLVDKFQAVPQSIVTMHPGAADGVCFELSFMFEKLKKAGVLKENVVRILNLAQENMSKEQQKKKAFVDAWVAKYLLDNIRISSNREAQRYHVFCGNSGQGKTSTLIKMASDLSLNKSKKIAILTTDTKKMGAIEQLKTYAQILNVPFAVVRRPEDWVAVEKQLSGMDHILVDFPGLSLKKAGELDWFKAMLPPSSYSRAIHYVQSVLSKSQDISEIATRYQSANFDDVIFTKLDETTQHGVIYNFQREFNVPLHSFGIGGAIPEDFEAATKERFLDLIFKLTKFGDRKEQV